jgi:tetratricopeptide (TPR) repeat protein
MNIASRIVVALSIPLGLFAQDCFDPASYRSNDPVAERNFQTGSSYYSNRQYTAALRYLSQAADQRHPRAQQLVGQMYENGYGVRPNLDLAVKYFKAAAAQGHRGALAELGFVYSQQGVNLAEADEYMLRAARCGSVDSEVGLGLNYEFGRGVQRNRRTAVYWLSQAAPVSGPAADLLRWLQDPNTPSFQSLDQLAGYINARTGRRVNLSGVRGVPRPGVAPSYCGPGAHHAGGDPTSPCVANGTNSSAH